MILIFLIAITTLRLAMAASGHLGETEAYLLLCGHHLDWSFVERPAGVPVLIRFGTDLFGVTPLGVRLFSPLLLCVASFVVASVAQALHGKKIALWSVIAFNLLPLTNAASLVIEGTVVAASWWILAVAAAWRIISDQTRSLSPWIIFGLLLGMGTQFSYPIGLLLLVVFLWELLMDGKMSSYEGAGTALFFLILGWVGPLVWNFHHDWLSWSRITWNAFWSWHVPVGERSSPFFWSTVLLIPLLFVGVAELVSQCKEHKKHFPHTGALLVLLALPSFFYLHEVGHGKSGFLWLLVLLAFLLPSVITLFFKKNWLKKSGLALLVLMVFCTLLSMSGLFSPKESTSYWEIPNVQGVSGLQPVAVTLLRWRVAQQDPTGKLPFLIAQSPGLAALLGSVLPITYPELPAAPPVFVPESPSLESQFQLWPHYAEATAATIVDPLYTEEKVTSPFLSRDALYVTSETSEEIPQTIHGAFAVVEPLEEIALKEQGRERKLFIYHCKNYQMLSL